MMEVLDPTREAAGAQAVYAERSASLKGKRIGLIENTKYNSDNVLERIGAILMRDYGAASFKLYHKRYSSVPAHDELIAALIDECDLMVAGVGDCGSCSSGSVLDGILLEMRNIPSASIITHLFENTGRAMARQWGMPDYKFLIMEHPIANLPDDLLQQRAELIAPQVAQLLMQLPHSQAREDR
ncbi:UGSC family (seleno)protein [Paraburkholderia sediminicola]|uniref:UGSC family (seleno)protein n=1 Tax=Paraburkholderia sediminicola TaxID=458836 RepID=UPI000E735E36